MTTEHPRIVLDPKVLAGKPVIRGTRLSVEFIIGLMADGWSEADILSNYPGVTHEDIIACLAYARDALTSEGYSRARHDMRFSANENLAGMAVEALKAAGHDVVWVRTAAPGMADPGVLAWAAREERILLTFDKDLGGQARVAALPSACGIILFRMRRRPPACRYGHCEGRLGGPLLRHRAGQGANAPVGPVTRRGLSGGNARAA
jgi:uncharacterized protein (DUF433 family)